MFSSTRLGLRTAFNTASARTFGTSRPSALARIQLIGRLADAPEQTPTSTGREMVRYALGVSTGAKDEHGNRQTSWFRVASFQEGGGRDVLLGLTKGSLIHVEADAKMDTFTTQDGQQQTRLNLIQRSFEILSRNNRHNDTSGAESSSNRSAAEEPESGLGAS